MSRYDINNLIEQVYKNLEPLGKKMANSINDLVIPKSVQIGSQIPLILKEPDTQELLLNITSWIKNNEKNNPDMSGMLDELESNNNYSEAIQTIPIRLLFRLIMGNDKFEDINLRNLINHDLFKKDFLKFFDEIDIGIHFKNRKPLMEEALQLYKLGMYAGCLTLLHSQFEGILTDYLIFRDILVKDKKNGKTKFYEVTKLDKCVKKKEAEVTGLSKKIELAKTIGDTFKRLDSYIFDNDQNVKFHNERNDILHGSNISNFSAERCFIIFIWIDSILGSIHIEEQLRAQGILTRSLLNQYKKA